MVIKKSADFIRIIIRRPHAYEFKRRFPGSPIPGVVILSVDGKLLDSLVLPSKNSISALLDRLSKNARKKKRL